MISWTDVILKAGNVLKGHVEITPGKYLIKKTRDIQINLEGHQFQFRLDLDISFEPIQQKNISLNKADILLLSDEFVPFITVLRSYEYPLFDFHYQLVENPQIVCLYIEAKEPPGRFAERIAIALDVIDCL